MVSGQTQPTASISRGLTGDHLVNKQLDEIEQQKVQCNSTQNHFIQQMRVGRIASDWGPSDPGISPDESMGAVTVCPT